MTKEKTPAHMIELARNLRQNQTNAETLIWQLVRNRQVANAKFRRQQPIEGYIADFYCHQYKLVIELDGSQHFTEDGIKQDALRTQRLNQLGITVLRFDNRQVLLETEAVLQVIYEQLKRPQPNERPHPSPLPEGEGISSPRPLGEDLGEGYRDIAGYCKSASLDDIKANDYVLTPGRYVGAADIEDDGIAFETKMRELSQTLFAQMKEAETLDKVIRQNLEGLGYGE